MYPRAIEICISESYSRLVALMIFAALHNRKLFRSSVPLTVYNSESCLVVPRANSGASRFTTQRAASCFLCRELLPVCCAESYLKIRSGVPRATPGLLCRELLPVCCAETYLSICYFSVRSPTNWSVAPRRSVQRRHLEQQLQSRPRATVCCAERLVCRELPPDGCDYVVSNAFCEVANNPLVQRHVGSGRRVAT